MKWYKPDPTGFYMPGLHKLLFIAGSEEYYRIDGWPMENERLLYFKATSEIPLLQGTLLSILIIGISKGHPLNGRDAVDLVNLLKNVNIRSALI
jgi:integrator complex subunit 1